MDCLQKLASGKGDFCCVFASFALRDCRNQGFGSGNNLSPQNQILNISPNSLFLEQFSLAKIISFTRCDDTLPVSQA